MDLTQKWEQDLFVGLSKRKLKIDYLMICLSGKFTPGDSIVLDHDKKADDLTIEKSKKVKKKSLAKKILI